MTKFIFFFSSYILFEKCEGGLVKIVDGSLKDKTVLFEREDFYVCGVHVGSADLRMLLRPGDKVSLQVYNKH